MPCYIPRRFPRCLQAYAKRRRILVGSVRICLISALIGLHSVEPPSAVSPGCPGLLRPSSGRVPTPVPRPVQLGSWAGGKRRPAGQKSERKDKPDPRVRCLSTNRMNSSPDRYASPTLPPAMRELAALCEYSEGSHEANARQRNPGRGVARRTG